MSKLLERHQMESLENGRTDKTERVSLEPSLQEQIEAMRKRYVFNRPGSPDHLSLEEAKSMLSAMDIDSIETAIEMGIVLDITPVYSRGLISLRDYVTKVLETEALVEEESALIPTPVV